MVSKKFVPVSALLATAIRISAYPGRKNVIQKKNKNQLEKHATDLIINLYISFRSMSSQGYHTPSIQRYTTIVYGYHLNIYIITRDRVTILQVSRGTQQ